jgi:hypothetical protein
MIGLSLSFCLKNQQEGEAVAEFSNSWTHKL